MRTNPWQDLEGPSVASAVNARRVDERHRWDFFWGRDAQGKYLLILNHHLEPEQIGPIAHLKDIEVVSVPKDACGRATLLFKLLDTPQSGIFYTLCRDVISSTETCDTEEAAVKIALRRMWRWHYLLRGSAGGRLPMEAQKGLIGELLVLENFLLPRLHAHDVVEAWGGPMGAPKDFEIDRIGVEVKARRGGATPLIAISNEFQLDDEGIGGLFLFVVELNVAIADGDGFTLAEIASRLHGRICEDDPVAAEDFERRLYATGFCWEDDYSDSRWLWGGTHIYSVAEGFPRITASQAAGGVRNVKYSISLPDCADFIVEESAIDSAWRLLSDAG